MVELDKNYQTKEVGLRLQDLYGFRSRDETLKYVGHTLLEIDISNLNLLSKSILKPYHGQDSHRKCLIVSSASSSSASQEAECGILAKTGHIIDIPGAIEGRDTKGASKGDVAIISTAAGLRMAASSNGISVINLAHETVGDFKNHGPLKGSDIYYKADALLSLMMANPDSVVIKQLINIISEEPLVHPYNLDEETQLVLLWLSKMAGVETVYVNANSPEVAVELTRKGFRYPTVEDASKLKIYDDPYAMQKAEWELSQAAREINYHSDFVPGYSILRGKSSQELFDQVCLSIKLLNERYGFVDAWVKPDRGTDGGNQGAINFYDLNQIKNRIESMWSIGGNWVIEARTKYFTIMFPYGNQIRQITTTPSVHIIKGSVRDTISLQLSDSGAWGGNLICTERTWSNLVDLIDTRDPRIATNPNLINKLKGSFGHMTDLMKNYTKAVNNSIKYSGGQVRGGADLAVSTLGGKFGDELVIAVQDYNARANGCEPAYALYDSIPGEKESKSAVTRNVTPKVGFETFSSMISGVIRDVNNTYNRNIDPESVRVIAVSAGWGQIGIIGRDSFQILEDALLIEEGLRKNNIIL